MKVNETRHLQNLSAIDDLAKFRAIWEGGSVFINKYLTQFSKNEDANDFLERKRLTYNPAHAKAAVVEIKNAIFQRMSDITREGGSVSYQEAITGEHGGVDRKGNSMNGFIGKFVLPELLVANKVGIYIDRAPDAIISAADSAKKPPYLYIYKHENIRDWTIDESGNFVSLLLRDEMDVIDSKTGLSTGKVDNFRLLRKTDTGVTVQFFNAAGNEIRAKAVTLNLSKIPFVCLELNQPLLQDISNYQIAMLNMASADVAYGCKSNFPFYTEQFDPVADRLSKQIVEAKANEENAGFAPPSNPPTAAQKSGSTNDVKVGATRGRRYPKGVEAPSFINPSSEPLTVSMAKQEQMKTEIRQLVALALTNIKPQRASAESKQKDDAGLEAGLSYIGLELEYGEREIANIWMDYEAKTEEKCNIVYPDKYSLKTTEERMAEAIKLLEIAQKLSSITAQREMCKRAIDLAVGNRFSRDTMEAIFEELDEAAVPLVIAADLLEDVKEGIVSKKVAASIRLYPEGDVEVAAKEHADRLAEIAKSQSAKEPAQRGVKDMSPDPNAKKGE